MTLIIVMMAIAPPSSIALPKAFQQLTAEDFTDLRQGAIGNRTGKPLHSKVAAVFGLVDNTPILVSEILFRGRGPDNQPLVSSIWFSSTTDDAFFVEQHGQTVTIYLSDANRVLRAAAVGAEGVNDLNLISNETAATGFQAILRLWADHAHFLRK